MKIKEMNLANAEAATNTLKRNRGSLGGIVSVCAVVAAVAVLSPHRALVDADNKSPLGLSTGPAVLKKGFVWLPTVRPPAALRRWHNGVHFCYFVTSEPSIGEVEKFETVSTEFVGQGTLFGDDFTR